MFRKPFLLLSVLLLVGSVASCRTAYVYNVYDTHFTTPAPSLQAASKAVKVAGSGLGWQINEIEPGKLVGTLYARAHMAAVDITHDLRTYSITYKNSNNLRYNGTTIHPNYNSWVENLRRAIALQTVAY